MSTGQAKADLVIPGQESAKILVETKRGLRSYRDLRDKILSMAILLESTADAEGRLVLLDPELEDDQITGVWDQALSTIREDVADRVSLSVIRDNRATVGADLRGSEQIEEYVSEAYEHAKSSDVRMPRTKYFYVIQKILITRWILDKDFISAKDLSTISGSSYPTVASAIQRLDRCIERGPKNSLRLARFPNDEFFEMVAQGPRARFTIKFVDTSGRPRAPARLLEKLHEITGEDVAIGGTFGAKHWYPDLDLMGAPRLDLSVHAPSSHINVDFVRLLDPALEPAQDQSQEPNLVVHAVRRAESLFDGQPPKWADPTECLLDLFEMGFTQQASAWLDSIKRSRLP